MKRWVIVGAAAIAAVIVWAVLSSRGPGELDGFAQCLGERGAVFYGAFWCSHCADQKELFGSSAGSLPYVECSTPDGRQTTRECIGAGIMAYPTWEFPPKANQPQAGAERIEGVVSLKELSEKTGCRLP